MKFSLFTPPHRPTRLVEAWQTFPTYWHPTHEIPYVDADLVALKRQRQPGIGEI